jgi:hypothetical protein
MFWGREPYVKWYVIALPDTALYLTNYLFRMGVYHNPFNLAEAVETALQDLSILDAGASVNWLTQGVGPALERVVFDVSNSPNGGCSCSRSFLTATP